MTRAKALTTRFALPWRQRDRDPSSEARDAGTQAMRNDSPEDWARYGGGLVAPDLAEHRDPLRPAAEPAPAVAPLP